MSQHGLLRRAQMLEMGLSRGKVRRMLGNGHVIRVHRGVYRTSGAPNTWEQSLLSACMAGGGATASFSSACRLHGSTVVPAHDHEITVVRGTRPSRLGAHTVHRARRLAASEVTRNRGIPVTTPLRTLSDMAPRLDDAQLADLICDFLSRQVITAAQLARHVAGAAARRPGAPRLRRVALGLFDDGVPESVAESRLIQHLQQLGFPEPERQYEVRTAERRVVARVDLGYPDHQVAIEMDGYRWHSGPRQFNTDRRRDLELAALGWRVFRMTPANLADGGSELWATLARVLGRGPERARSPGAA
jgi:very-short-patch-repair endonuclease